jgi:hypothetical protein
VLAEKDLMEAFAICEKVKNSSLHTTPHL